jgi:hypothetical protein
MVYCKIPAETHLEEGVDRQEFGTLKVLFCRYNYRFTFFGHDTITFFDAKNEDERGYVPIHNRYCMDKREFAAFVGLLQKLDTAEKRLTEQLVQLSTIKGAGY